VLVRLQAVVPIRRPPLRLDRGVLERRAGFDMRFGIHARGIDVQRAFAFGVAE
jgi:hypothetical protein